MRRAKIVATLGPASSTYDQLRALIRAGMNVARFNLSHGSHAIHEEVYANLQRASADEGVPVAILADLQGPKIRLETFADGPHLLNPGDVLTITTEDTPGTKDLVGTTFKGLPQDVKPGDTLLVDDGKIQLEAIDTTQTTVVTKVIVGGMVSNNKGINLPGVAVSVPALSDKDEDDLRWALKLGVDYVALSFVRNAEDVVRVRDIMAEQGITAPVIAKIEKPQAVEVLHDIVDSFDGIMVARGDLGVELPPETVPIVQKQAIEEARRWAKPVIVATQMLESMISNPVPTRAETSDVANAILDGADAVMLSGETSVGQYPIQTVETMARICASTEVAGADRVPPLGTKPKTLGGAITLAAVDVAEFVDAKFVCIFSESGDSARRMSRLRSLIPMLAFTPSEATRRRMALTWGIESVQVDRVGHTDAMYQQVDDILLGRKLAKKGDKVVVISGSPPGIPGSTNDLRVHQVGDATSGAAPVWKNGA
ncbi:MAG: Pyruvate kinase [Cellulomonadaceae bacterium TMED98]|nr:MAG: Pyruvate kinase [Cellulomonadaceae bacterium TMED98]